MGKEESNSTMIDQGPQQSFPLSPDRLIDLVELYLNREFDDEIQELESLPLPQLESFLKTSLDSGLSSSENLSERIEVYGSNKKAEPKLDSFWDICWDTLKDKINVVLLILGIVSLIIGATGDHPTYGWIEGFAILAVVFIIVVVSGTVGYSKVKKFKELQDLHKNRAAITIMRDGQKKLVHPEEVLVGDKVFLDTGDMIPADSIILVNNNLLANEAALTGENDLMHKDTIKKCQFESKKYQESMIKNPMLKRDKHIVPSPIVISGTSVAQGTAWVLAIAVGPNSKEGRISDLAEQEEENTPLENKLDDVTERVSYLGLAAGGIALVSLYLRFFIQYGTGKYEWKGSSSVDELIGYFLISFTVIAVAVPEGLPMAVTICLAYSVKKMQKDNNLVKKLAACETMGGADCICSDKTGTLTQNMMVLKKLACYVNKELAVNDQENLKDLFAKHSEYFDLLKEGISLCTAGRVELKNDKEVDVGAQTELAVIKLLRSRSKHPDEYLEIRKNFEDKIVKVNPFSSERKKSSIVVRKEQGYRAYVIGAPDFIVKYCNKALEVDMQKIVFGTTETENFLNSQEKMAGFGLRTLSLAFRDFNDEALAEAVDNNNHPIIENEELTLISLFGIYDPPRLGVRDAVKSCRLAGIKVRMVTGDNAATAEAIAREVGITENSENVIEGSLFNHLVGGVMCDKCEDKKMIKDPRTKELTEDEFISNDCTCPIRGKGARNDVIVNFEKFKEIIDKIDVVARCAPEHKYTIVTGLKQLGHVVAVTGDGTNDAPALRKANVGFAMGIAGTEYARQAADIILIDDNFSSIVKATIWGRGIYDNIQRFIQFQLTVNVVAVICCIVGAISIQQSCLTAVQMLWVNMIMDSLASLALATEEPTPSVLNRAPQNPNEFIITPLMFKHIFGQAFAQVVLLFVFMYYGENIFREFDSDKTRVCHNPGNSDYVCSGRLYYPSGAEDYKVILNSFGPSRHFTYIFNIFILFQLFNEINSRRIKDEFCPLEDIKKSPMFIIIWIVTIFIQVIIVEVGYWAFSVNKYGLTVEQWFICIAWGAICLIWRFVLLCIPGFGKKKIHNLERIKTFLNESIHGSKKKFSSSYKIA